MASSVVGVFSAGLEKRQALASALGKKGSADDITVYNTSFGGKLVTAVEPTLYPKKLEAMLFSAYLSDYCIVAADAPSQELGEIIVSLDLLGKEKGCLLGMLDWDMLAKGTVLEKYDRADSEKEAAEKALAFEPAKREGTAVAVIDHSFDVKGVGQVALGFVMAGTIKTHDSFRAWPSENSLEIRSIQMQDEDQPAAFSSDRFGMSFKGMKTDELDRGMVLAREAVAAKEFQAEFLASKFCKRPVEDGEALHFACGLQVVPGKIESAEPIAAGKEAKARIVLDRAIAISGKDAILACRLNEKGLRVVGKIYQIL